QLPNGRGAGAGAGEVDDFILGKRFGRGCVVHRGCLSAGHVLLSLIRLGEYRPCPRPLPCQPTWTRPGSPSEAGLIGVGMACTGGRPSSAKRRRLFSALCRGIPPSNT